MARPTLSEQARRLRLSKGLTQREAARMMDRNPTYISQLENGEKSLAEAREYLDRLETRRASRKRTPGGELNAGRLRRRPVVASSFRGEPLRAEFDHAATLPQSERWSILGLCRTAPDTELAFLFHEEVEIFGLVGFHLINGEVKRGRIISITEEHDAAASVALEAFAEANLVSDDDEALDALSASDDGLLADDEG